MDSSKDTKDLFKHLAKAKDVFLENWAIRLGNAIVMKVSHFGEEIQFKINTCFQKKIKKLAK